MKQQYIKQVEKNLNVLRKVKKDVLRDLDEAFASVLEHGETEQEVLERLGTPEEFAESIQEQFGISCAEQSKWEKQIGIIAAGLISLIAFAAAFFIHVSRPAKDLIGQADAATTIQISGSGIDMFVLMILLGCVAFAIALGLAVHYIHKKD